MLCVSCMRLSCSAAHPVQAALHKPITVVDYYIRRKVNKKLAKAAGKVLESLVRLYHTRAC